MLDTVKIATLEDLDEICRFYQEVCDGLKSAKYSPEWAWPIYPNRAILKEDIEEKQILLGYQGQTLATAGVISAGEDPDYQSAPWNYPAPDKKIAVIHLYAVGAAFRGQGISSAMLQTMIHQIQSDGYQVIHLDAVKENVPAVKLYESNGFEFVEDRPVDLDEFGVHTLRIMEYLL